MEPNIKAELSRRSHAAALSVGGKFSVRAAGTPA
jgi:hypothetical protein